MRLADNRITADATQFFGNLAGGHAFFPHRLQLVDPFVSPGQYPFLTFFICSLPANNDMGLTGRSFNAVPRRAV